MPPHPHRNAKSDAHPAVGPGHNGPITRSRGVQYANAPTIHRLPLEVLSEIFILAMPTIQEIYAWPSSHQPSEGQKIVDPSKFCAVCSSWRLLAFSTPQLWKHVFVHVPYSITEDQAKKIVADLIPWIERSKPLPLTLHISGDLNVSVHGTGPEAPIVSFLIDHAARWDSLYCKRAFLDPSSYLPPPRFHVDVWHSLRRVCLIGIKSCYLTSCVIVKDTLPWAQLTLLNVQNSITVSQAETIFISCPKLVQLSISVRIAQGAGGVSITLRDLVTFYLSTDSSCRGLTVNRLTSPSLRNMFINGFSSTDIGILLDFFTRSSCTLDKLGIRGTQNIASRDYINVLQHRSCQSLTLLSLCYPLWHKDDMSFDSDEALLQRLTLHRNDTICSRLKFLTITYSVPSSLHSTFLNMVESRIRSRVGQITDEPTLRYLQLHVRCPGKKMKELDKIGKRSGMEYRRQRIQPCHWAVWFQCEVPPSLNPNDLLF
ncbi:hypothetical protein F5887DRAFT_996613 [Amanita rubescens]|nr:hypothetical protein F5887DRAFT_996613 [Amanita rubescens]